MKKRWTEIPVSEPEAMGSYNTKDVIFLLKNISGVMTETVLQERETAIQGGVHYSEMLPVEFCPSPVYMDLFYQTLRETATKVALAVGTVAELILRKRGTNLVLVSLARAGTPVGILIKRYLNQIYGVELPHYSVSIIRDKGIDENALIYILQRYPDSQIQFVDGWTGKGVITQVLAKACQDFQFKYDYKLDPDLAVLADPGYCVRTYGTREDFLIPSACLNSTVSGLVSRTVFRRDIIGSLDFHGAKYYRELGNDDVSELFVDTIATCFKDVEVMAKNQALQLLENSFEDISWQGLKDVKAISQHYGIEDINLIKPGVGETTRVLLRRLPWKVIVTHKNNPNLNHIFLLAAERGVPIEEYPGLSYSCCGIINKVK